MCIRVFCLPNSPENNENKKNVYLEDAPKLKRALIDDPVIVSGPGVGVTTLLHGLSRGRCLVVVLVIVVVEATTAG